MTAVSMQAIRLTEKCETSALKPVLMPRPIVKSGSALIKVKAFGVNESEMGD